MNDSFDNRSIASSKWGNWNPLNSTNSDNVIRAHVPYFNEKTNLKIERSKILKDGKFSSIEMIFVTHLSTDDLPEIIYRQKRVMKTIEYNKPNQVERQMLIKFQGMHRNIINLHYYVLSHRGNKTEQHLIMDFMPEDMSAMIKRLSSKQIKLEERVVKSFSSQILSALEYMHSFDIAHRDICPQNILVDKNLGHLKITDFGSAKQIISDKKNSVSVGSRFYQAPEIIWHNQYYNVSVDIWSAGCVIAFLVHQEPIFKCEGEDLLTPIVDLIGQPQMNESDKILTLDNSTLKKIINNDDLTSFLMSLFNYNYDERISAKDAINHSYLLNIC